MRGILYDVVTSNYKTLTLIVIFLMVFVRPYVVKVPFELPILALSSAVFASAVLAQTIPMMKENKVLEYVFIYSKKSFRATLISLALSYAIIASTLSMIPLYDKPKLAVYAASSAAGFAITLTVVEVTLPAIVARAANLILMIGSISLTGMTNLDIWSLPPLLLAMAFLSLTLSIIFEKKVRDRVVSPT